MGLSPAQLHSLSARGEAREIADLGEHYRGGGEADAGDRAELPGAFVAGEGRLQLFIERVHLRRELVDEPQRRIDPAALDRGSATLARNSLVRCSPPLVVQSWWTRHRRASRRRDSHCQKAVRLSSRSRTVLPVSKFKTLRGSGQRSPSGYPYLG